MPRNISHTIGVASGYMESLCGHHWEGNKWALWYLRATSYHCISFNGGGEKLGKVNI